MAIAWRIYYDDGSTFDSAQGTPEEAPAFGFICAVGYDETGQRYIQHSWDFYQYDKKGKQWWGMDYAGLIDRLCHNKVYAFKLGRTITKTEYARIMLAAHEDKDFPKIR